MLNKKVIAFYLGDFRRSGGTERACISVANSLSSETDLRVVVLTTNRKGEKPFFEISDRVDIIYLEVESFKKEYFQLIKKIKNTIRIEGINILVAVEVMSILLLFPFFFSKKLKTIVWEHFNYTVTLNKKMRYLGRKFAAKFADTIVVLTKRDVELWTSNLKVKGKIVSINNPSPYEISQFEYNDSSKTVIAIGRLTYQKGFDRLIDIWSRLIEKFPESKEWTLEIIGSGPDKDKLEKQVINFNLSKYVILIPNTNNIKSHYEKASFLAMTSRFEGLPMTLIEAQSFNLPIIAYDCLTGPSEVISLYSGLLIKDNQKEEFVDSLYKLMKDSNLRSKMSKAAHIEVNRFGIKTIVRNWLSVIHN